MIFLKTFEQFDIQEYTVGDIVKLHNNDMAKIIKTPSKNTYIINILRNDLFIPDPIQIYGDDINCILKPNNAPALGADLTISPSTNPSNDLVINNGIPDIPLANTVLK